VIRSRARRDVVSLILGVEWHVERVCLAFGGRGDALGHGSGSNGPSSVTAGTPWLLPGCTWAVGHGLNWAEMSQ
jgi:hypothetical protein